MKLPESGLGDISRYLLGTTVYVFSVSHKAFRKESVVLKSEEYDHLNRMNNILLFRISELVIFKG